MRTGPKQYRKLPYLEVAAIGPQRHRGRRRRLHKKERDGLQRRAGCFPHTIAEGDRLAPGKGEQKGGWDRMVQQYVEVNFNWVRGNHPVYGAGAECGGQETRTREGLVAQRTIEFG